MFYRQLFRVCLVAAAWSGSNHLLAETFSLGPDGDAFVSSANPDNNYGGAGAVAVSAAGLPQGAFQALFRFDLAGAKAMFDTTFGTGNWMLESASLQLTAASPNHSLFNASAAGQIELTWMQNDAWQEGAGTPNAPGGTGITWNTLPGFLSTEDESLGALAFDGATSGNKTTPFVISTGFNNDALAGSQASILLTPAASDGNVSALLNSRSFNNSANRPVLTLSAVAVPELASFWLAMWGLASWPFIRLRRWSAENS